jgi:hypothetical protein
MKRYIAIVREFVANNKRNIQFISGITLSVALVALFAGLFIYNSTPHYQYRPISACDLITDADATELIGSKTLNNVTPPVINGDTATSKCTYSDTNLDSKAVTVLALALLSGLNDQGTNQIRNDFNVNKPKEGIADITNLGDQAYFNVAKGQLNMLKDRTWFIISFGFGETPELNDQAKATNVAKKVLSRLAEI